jgi:hypothetical protein
MITRQTVGKKLQAYLNDELTLAQLVDWAENAVVDAELEEGYDKMLFDILGRIGLADVESFKLSWEEIAGMIEKLGYRATVALKAA